MYLEKFSHIKLLEPYPHYFIEISLNAISVNPNYKTDPNLFLMMDYENRILKKINANNFEQVLKMKYPRYGIGEERIKTI